MSVFFFAESEENFRDPMDAYMKEIYLFLKICIAFMSKTFEMYYFVLIVCK